MPARPDLGPDAHAGCLLAPCPRCAARTQARNAIHADWIAAGRPTQAQSIERIRAILHRPGALSGVRVPGEDDE